LITSPLDYCVCYMAVQGSELIPRTAISEDFEESVGVHAIPSTGPLRRPQRLEVRSSGILHEQVHYVCPLIPPPE
jgi:hypothetical protein